MELINLADIVRLIWKNRKLIISIALIAAIIAGIASFLITPYYKSSTTIYPGKYKSTICKGKQREVCSQTI